MTIDPYGKKPKKQSKVDQLIEEVERIFAKGGEGEYAYVETGKGKYYPSSTVLALKRRGYPIKPVGNVGVTGAYTIYPKPAPVKVEGTSEVSRFEFYAWIVRAGFLYRDNLRAQLERLGFPDEALGWALSDAARKHDLVGLYQDWGMNSPQVWEAFIADCRAKYEGIRDAGVDFPPKV